ncbi:MAG: heavy metal-responsive transcriptional regulator [Micavibrio sp.]|nr:heavy metal-responsive transcriptional regulator [Micavibrio sp.]MAZ00554.1 heavy metal-responsive transcriptional regulator [Micavibrio sp.]|tara:strand:+ start:1919 stop:2341 length:423 start_codon:yes stop_codon:yes gene_type:complete
MADMTIGQLARESGVRTDTIRYYEMLKLIEPVGRTNSGYRLYDAESSARVAFIKRAKLLGFKLSEIQSLLELHASDVGTAQDMLDLTETKIREAQKDIEDLMAMKKSLEDLAAECPGGDLPLSDCPIVTFLHSNHKHEGK